VVTLKAYVIELTSGKFIYNLNGASVTEAIVIDPNVSLSVDSGASAFVIDNDVTLAGTLNVKNGNIEVGETGVLSLNTNLTLPANSTLKVTNRGVLNVNPNANLIVPSSAKLVMEDGSTLTVNGAVTGDGAITTEGTGEMEFGASKFSGAGTWTASVSGGDTDNVTGVKITAASTGATIAAATLPDVPKPIGTATLTASGTPTITQAAGTANNALTIGANTVLALGGDGTAAGSIVLKGAAANPGKLTFENAGSGDVGTSLVTTGATSAYNKVTGNVTAPSTGTGLVWYAENATTGGKWSKVGASNASNGLTGGASDDVTLSGATTVTASP
jgi:fibronectin-binding autotransporter adhesin